MRRHARTIRLGPVMVGAGIVFPGVKVSLVSPRALDDRRRKPNSRLYPPKAVRGPVSFDGPGVSSAPSRRGLPKSKLGQPLLAPPGSIAPPLRVDLAIDASGVFQRARKRSRTIIYGPVVLMGPIVFPGPETKLVSPRALDDRRRRPNSRLIPPAVVAPGIAYGAIFGRLADSSRLGRATHSVINHPLPRPAVIYPGPEVKLAPSKRGRPLSFLRVPVVIGGGIAFYGPRVLCAPSKRGIPRSRLLPPVVVAAGLFSRPIEVTLVRSSRGRPSSKLSLPIVVGGGTVFRVLDIQLVPSAAIDPRRKPHSHLSAPAVVGGGIVFPGLRGMLAASKRGKPSSKLSGPAIVGAGVIAPSGPERTLAASSRGKTKSKLFAPSVVGNPIAFFGPGRSLAPSSRGKPDSKLFAPAVIGNPIAFSGPGRSLAPSATTDIRRKARSRLFPPTFVPLVRPTLVRLAASKRGRPTSVLHAPAVVGAGVVFAAVKRTLVASRRGKPSSRLSPPSVVTAVALSVPTKISLVKAQLGRRGRSRNYGPAVIGGGVVFAPLEIHLTPSRRGKPLSKISPPIVVVTFAPVGGPTKINLARAIPIRRGRVTYGPTQVATGIVFAPLEIRLAASRRGKPTSKLAPPRVVVAVAQLAPTKISLARTSVVRRSRSTTYGPAVVAGGIVFAPVELHLSTSRRGKTQSFLRPMGPVAAVAGTLVLHFAPATNLGRTPHSHLFEPAAIGAGIVFPGLYGKTAPSPTQGRKPNSRLFAPAVVASTRAFYGPRVRVSPSTRGVPNSRLAPPAVVGAGIVFAPISGRLTPSPTQARRQRSKIVRIFVSPIVAVYPTARIALAPSKRGRPFSHLRAPVVVGGGIVFPGPGRGLAVSRRGKAFSRLTPAIFFTPTPLAVTTLAVTLARSTRGKAKPRLFAPAVIGSGIAFYGPGIRLAKTVTNEPSSRLRPPTVVTPASTAVFAGPSVSLASSRRGKTQYDIGTPIIDVGAEFFYGPTAALAPSRRDGRRTQYDLGAPIVDEAPSLSFGPEVSLAASRRGKPIYDLGAPTGDQSREFLYGPAVTLARSTRGKTAYDIGTPLVRTEVVFPPILVNLAPSRRGQTIYDLGVPLVRPGIVSTPILVSLAPSRRGKPIYDLGVPLVRPGIVFSPVLVSLAPSKRGKTQYDIGTPIVDQGPVFYGAAITLAPSSRGKPMYDIGAPIVGAGIAFGGPEVVLAPSKRGRVFSHLSAPRVVGTPPAPIWPARIRLAPSRRGRTIFGVRGPTVIFGPEQINFLRVYPTYPTRPHPRIFSSGPALIQIGIVPKPIEVVLAPSRRGKPIHILRPPATLVVAKPFVSPMTISLASSSRGRTVYDIGTPLVGAGIVFGPIETNLATSRRGKPRSFLSPSLFTGVPVTFRSIVISLAPSSRGVTRYDIGTPLVGPGIVFPPVQINLAPSTRLGRKPFSHLLPPPSMLRVSYPGIQIHLARIKPVPLFARLSRPAIVGGSVIYFGPKIDLAAKVNLERRGTYYILRPPATITQPAPILRPILSHLAPSTRISRGPHSKLIPPAKIGSGIFFAPISGRLARLVQSQRYHSRTRLTPPPVVLGPPLAPPPVFLLAPSTRGKTISKLTETRVVFSSRLDFGPRITLAPQPKPKAVSHLGIPHFAGFMPRPVTVTLVRRRKPLPFSILGTPAVVNIPTRAKLVTHLVQIRPRPTLYDLGTPIVGEGIAFFGPMLSLAPSTRIPRRLHEHHLLHPTVIRLICYGTVTGVDRAAAENDISTSTPYGVFGGTSSATVISSTSSASTVTGGDTAAAENEIDDEKLDGC